MCTNLTGEESLEAEDIRCGLEGAENIGQEGERGEVGLDDVALKDTFTMRYSHHMLIEFYKKNIKPHVYTGNQAQHGASVAFKGF